MKKLVIEKDLAEYLLGSVEAMFELTKDGMTRNQKAQVTAKIEKLKEAIYISENMERYNDRELAALWQEYSDEYL